MVKCALKMIILDHRQFSLQNNLLFIFFWPRRALPSNDTRQKRNMDILSWQWKLFATHEMIQ